MDLQGYIRGWTHWAGIRGECELGGLRIPVEKVQAAAEDDRYDDNKQNQDVAALSSHSLPPRCGCMEGWGLL